MKERFHQRPFELSPFDEANDRICWRPAADIFRTPNGWLIKYDLAGVKTEDATISVAGSQVTIRGARRDSRLEDGSSYYSMEIAYNCFERTIELPCDLAGARAEIQSRDGILMLRLICHGEQP
jgi:HSP20 family protein